MNRAAREELQTALRRIERRWGPQAIAPAGAGALSSLVNAGGISTGITALDQLLRPQGIPLHAITQLSGSTTCGKLTAAYHILAQAQHVSPTASHAATGQARAAILDFGRSTDADYLIRCGVDLGRLLLVRPDSAQVAGRVLVDLVQSRELRVILLDSLPDLLIDPAAARGFEQMLPQVNLALKGAPTAVILLDEPQPPWLPPLPNWTNRAAAHYAALRIELTREGWIDEEGDLAGYCAQARIQKRRGAVSGRSISIAIEFGRATPLQLGAGDASARDLVTVGASSHGRHVLPRA